MKLLFAIIAILYLSCSDDQSNLLTVKVVAPYQEINEHYLDEFKLGLASAKLQNNYKLELFYPESSDQAKQLLSRLISTPNVDNQLELISSISPQYISMLNSYNCNFNNKFILHINGEIDYCENGKSFDFRVVGASFQGGVAAMHLSNLKKAAIIAHDGGSKSKELIDGFKAGVSYGGGTVTELIYLEKPDIKNVKSAELIASIEKSLKSADIIFAVVSSEAEFVIEALKEHNKNGVKAKLILNGGDLSFYALETIIGTVVRNVSEVTTSTILEAQTGTYTKGHKTLGMKENGSYFKSSVFFEKNLSDILKESYESAISYESAYFE